MIKLLKLTLSLFLLCCFFFVTSCSKDDGSVTTDTSTESESPTADGDFSFDSDGGSFSDAGGGSSGGSGNGGNGNQAGLVTAGEWNDLENWSFWMDLLEGETYGEKSAHWRFYTQNRVAVVVKNGDAPVINANVALQENGEVVWETKTDNAGKAELFIGTFEPNDNPNLGDFTLFLEGEAVEEAVKTIEQGINEVQTNLASNSTSRAEICFIVDATGSMGDELEFLKDDLEDVIKKVQNQNSGVNVLTSSVFYRDEGDEYVVKVSDFAANLRNTLDFISAQSANGGGDFPEAVHTALNSALDLQWSDNSKARIAFLLLDAPPHYDQQVVTDLQNAIRSAAQKGIKLIPITASGIDKDTEFLMRFFSVITNGTYVFITNDSGIGGEHLEASVGQYEVEFLNDLMVRLIGKYVE